MSLVTPVGSAVAVNSFTTGGSPGNFQIPTGLVNDDLVIITARFEQSINAYDQFGGNFGRIITNDAGWMYIEGVQRHPFVGLSVGQGALTFLASQQSSTGPTDLVMARFYDGTFTTGPTMPANMNHMAYIARAYRNVNKLTPFRLPQTPQQFTMMGLSAGWVARTSYTPGNLGTPDNLIVAQTIINGNFDGYTVRRGSQFRGPTPIAATEVWTDPVDNSGTNPGATIWIDEYQWPNASDSINLIPWSQPGTLTNWLTNVGVSGLQDLNASTNSTVNKTTYLVGLGGRQYVTGTVNLVAGTTYSFSARAYWQNIETDGTTYGYSMTVSDGSNPEYGVGFWIHSPSIQPQFDFTYGAGFSKTSFEQSVGGNFETLCPIIHGTFTALVSGPHELRLGHIYNGSLTTAPPGTYPHAIDKIWLTKGDPGTYRRTIGTAATARDHNVNPGAVEWNVTLTRTGIGNGVPAVTVGYELMATQPTVEYRAHVQPTHDFITAFSGDSIDFLTTSQYGFAFIGMNQNFPYGFDSGTVVLAKDWTSASPGIYYAEMTMAAPLPAAPDDGLNYIDGIIVAPLLAGFPDGGKVLINSNGTPGSFMYTRDGVIHEPYFNSHSTGQTYSTGDVIGVLLDLRTTGQGGPDDLGGVSFFKNGTLVLKTSLGDPANGDRMRLMPWKLWMFAGSRSAYYNNTFNRAGPFVSLPAGATPWFQIYSPPPSSGQGPAVYPPIMVPNAGNIQPKIWMPREDVTVRSNR